MVKTRRTRPCSCIWRRERGSIWDITHALFIVFTLDNRHVITCINQIRNWSLSFRLSKHYFKNCLKSLGYFLDKSLPKGSLASSRKSSTFESFHLNVDWPLASFLLKSLPILKTSLECFPENCRQSRPCDTVLGRETVAEPSL